MRSVHPSSWSSNRALRQCLMHVVCGVWLLIASSPLAAEEQRFQSVAMERIREIFVPFEDLNVILESGGKRIFLDREKYEELVTKAKRTSEAAPPHAYSIASSDFDLNIEDGRATIDGTVVIDVVVDGTHAIPLEISHVGLRSATLDSQPAPLAQVHVGEAPLLFVTGKGQHKLKLEMVTPLAVSNARQTVRFRLPPATTGHLAARVPGNVELKSGGTVLNRMVDSDVTRFELLPTNDETILVMSLNNRTAKAEHVVSASNVYVVELTEAYERLHMTSSLQVLHGAVEKLQFAVPRDFEIIEVDTAMLSRWEIGDASDERASSDSRVLTVHLREPVNSATVLNIAAERANPNLGQWQLPQLQPLDVASSASIVSVLVASRLETELLQAENLLAIDTAVLAETLPESIFSAEPGAPAIQPVAAYYAPQTTYSVNGRFAKPLGRVQVVGNTVLTLREAGMEVRGGFALLPLKERIFGCNFTAPPGWNVTEVKFDDGSRGQGAQRDYGQKLEFEIFENPDGSSRVQVRLPKSVSPGNGYGIYFRARHIPVGWLDAWDSQQFEFPQFTVMEATSDRGAIAVVAEDDFEVASIGATGLIPLDNSRKTEFNLNKVSTDLALEFDARPFSTTINVSRKSPRITAESYSFFELSPGKLGVHYEILYDVKEAHARQLRFQLPADTPDEIQISGVGQVAVKESNKSLNGQARLWTVELTQPVLGQAHIAIDFETPLETVGSSSEATLNFPLLVVDGVEYQTGNLSVEGSAELEIVLATDARRVDAGELVDAQYSPGKRLLGAFGFVGPPPTISATYQRPEQHGLPAAIVQRAELITSVSPRGVSQSAARFALKTKASFVEIQLPENSSLWSVFLDGVPEKPQRDGERLLVGLPTTAQIQLRDLQIVYETNHGDIGIWDDYQATAPQLFLRASQDAEQTPLPVADLSWYIHLPKGYRLTGSWGTVHPNLAHIETARQIAGYESPVLRGAAQLVRGNAISHSLASGVLDGGQPLVRQQTSLSRELGHSEKSSVEFQAEMLQLRDEAQSHEVEALSGSLFGDTSGPMNSFDARSAAPSRSSSHAVPLERSERGQLSDGIVQNDTVNAPASEGINLGKALIAKQSPKRYWAIEGLRSLRIDLTAGDRPVLFQSLGQSPQLDVRLVNQRRIELLAFGTALLVLVGGVRLISQSWRRRLIYVASVLLIASTLPLLAGLDNELGTLFDWCMYAAVSLLPIYGIVDIVYSFGKFVVRVPGPVVSAMLLSALAVTWPQSTRGDESVELGPLEVKLLQPGPKLSVPDDAVIVPFHLDGELPSRGGGRVILPLETFERLQRLAFPEEVPDAALPAPYALAGAQWQTKLLDGDQLELKGIVRIDVLTDKNATILLPFDGGVLQRAQLAGQPARVQIIQSEQAQQVDLVQQTETQTPKQQQVELSTESSAVMAVYIKGRGVHELTLTAHYPLVRRGGWRVAQGHLPAAVATGLRFTVPKKNTQVRVSGVSDRTNYESAEDNQEIRTALGANGRFELQWRPQVSRATIDQSLTVASESIFDVQEDRNRLTCQLQLNFPRSERDTFTLTIPADYLVEGVDGENVRNWEDGRGKLFIELLKPARDHERITLRLATDSNVLQRESQRVTLPLVDVQDAALHEGRLAVRRSPWIELQATSSQGLVRTDLSRVKAVEKVSNVSPLGIRPFQAYEFSRVPYSLVLQAKPMLARSQAKLQTVLRIGQSERTAETRVALRTSGRPVYRVVLDAPGNAEITDVVAPEPFKWSATKSPTGQQVSIFMGRGQSEDFSVILRSKLGDRGQIVSMPLPRFTLQDVTRQETEIVVQSDPSYSVEANGLANCQTSLISEMRDWLAKSQESLSRLAIESDQTDFSGTLRLTRRTPRVTCMTVSNLRVTDRVFEETVLLDYSIREAGIREVSFLLPADMADARVDAQLVQSKTVEQVEGRADLIRFRLALQDEVIGDFRVLIEHDRLLTSNQRSVPIPTVENARARQQFVALESAGRDEVVIDSQQQLETLSRQQSNWRTLSKILGDSITQAFQVQAVADAPQLLVSTQDRQQVETTTARIAFAQTNMIMDSSGTYRAAQRYHLNNRTEQFLTIQLPQGAALWTATVAGEPVKPIAARQAGEVRIPLVKTAEGESDYLVELKYGGRTGSVKNLSKIDFPLMKTINIKVESSQVSLRVPASHRWFGFGGTMRQVESDSDFLAGYLRYQTEQLSRFTKGMSSKNPYAVFRCVDNAKQISESVTRLQRQAQQARGKSAELRAALRDNELALDAAQRELKRFSQNHPTASAESFNRSNLWSYFDSQSNTVANEYVNGQGLNFAAPKDTKKAARESVTFQHKHQIDSDWLDRNQLRNDSGMDGKQKWGSRVQVAKEKAKSEKSKYVLGQLVDDSGSEQQNREAAESNFGSKLDRYQRWLANEQQSPGQQQSQQQLAIPRHTGNSIPGDMTLPNLPSRPAFAAEADLEGEGRDMYAAGYVGGGGFASPNYEALGLASLDVTLPQRGIVYRFTTPRGNIELQARAIDHGLWFRFTRLLVVIAAIVLVWAVSYVFRTLGSQFRSSVMLGVLLILTGGVTGIAGYLLLCGLLLSFGVAMIARGCWIRISNRVDVQPVA